MNQKDDLDQLLGAFYRSEMPNPWPTLRRPAKTVPAREPARSAWADYSRFALAASLAILLGGAWMLSGKFGTPTDSGVIIGPGSAVRDKGLQMPDKGKKPEDLVPGMK